MSAVSTIRNFYPKNQLGRLYFWGILYAFVMCLFPPQEFVDTVSYLNAWQIIKDGQLDVFRTPVYPAFIGIFVDIFGQKIGFYLIQILQYLVLLWSLKYFYRTVVRLVRPGRIVFWICFIYVATPLVAGQNSAILTEGLSISIFTIFIYSCLQIWDKIYSVKTKFALILCPLILLFLRPAFLFLLLALAIFIVFLLCKRNIKGVKYVGLSLILMGISFYSYSSLFEKQHGLRAISYVSLMNRYIMVRQNGEIEVTNRTPAPIVADVEEINKTSMEFDSIVWAYRDFYYLYNKHGLNSVNNLINESIKANPKLFLKKIGSRAYRFRDMPFGMVIPSIPGSSLFWIICPKFTNSYYLIIVYICFICVMWFINKKPPLFSAFLFVLVMGVYCVTMLGAQGEWPRLCVPAIPILLIMTGQMLSSIKISRYINFKVQ